MGQPLSEVLGTLATELDELAAASTQLQDALSRGGYAEMDVEVVQDLDRMTQTLAALASFIGNVRADLRCPCSVDLERALATVRLAEIAQRMRGHPTLDRAVPHDVELF